MHAFCTVVKIYCQAKVSLWQNTESVEFLSVFNKIDETCHRAEHAFHDERVHLSQL